MDERNLLKIENHLKGEVAQKRIRQNIQRGRDEATVTIGRAARLTGFSESQLRDWEKMGLLKPMRPKEELESKGTAGQNGQRQYSFTELDKLAIIRELLQEAKVNPGSIPTNIDEIWETLSATVPDVHDANGQAPGVVLMPSPWNGQQIIPIDERVMSAYRDNLAWRYYASRALWFSLLLLYEDVPGFYAGLILPAQELFPEGSEIDPNSLPDYGEALVGWLGQTGSFFTFHTPAPSFAFPSDFAVQPLFTPEVLKHLPASPANRTLIVVQRDKKAHIRRLETAARTAQRLLEPLYQKRACWQSYFNTHEHVDPCMDYRPKLSDSILTGLIDMVIRLGGTTLSGEDRWNACYVLQPDTLSLPLQQRNLIVRAKSEHAPLALGVLIGTPERYSTILSQRAYLGGHSVYRSALTLEDTTPVFYEAEGPVGSSIAVPIGGETGQPDGVLYVTSRATHAFNEHDQRVLRIMNRIIEELLHTYATRQQATKKMLNLLDDPGTVDLLFKDFYSENEFLHDVERLLSRVQRDDEPALDGSDIEEPVSEISFIALDLDMDVQERVATMYGDQILRHLHKAVGLRISDLLAALFTNYRYCKLYHMYAGRYYLFLRGFSLEKTKNNAERLRRAFEGNIPVKQAEFSGGTLTISDISVHLGVTWYPYEKLREFVQMPAIQSMADVSSTFYHALDLALKMGTGSKGGNIVYAWDSARRTYEPYQPGAEISEDF